MTAVISVCNLLLRYLVFWSAAEMGHDYDHIKHNCVQMKHTLHIFDHIKVKLESLTRPLFVFWTSGLVTEVELFHW